MTLNAQRSTLNFLRCLMLLSACLPVQTAADAPPAQVCVNEAVAAALTRFAPQGLQSNQLAVTLIDLGSGAASEAGSFRGEEPIYPASVVKLFYLAAAHRWLEDGRLSETEELRRAMRDMIVDSSNDATHYVLDLLTDTTSGPELAPEAMKQWEHRRNAVNRYYAALGYERISRNQEPWGDGPYGRERVFVGREYENRNRLTTQATARLLADIALGRAISPARSAAMMKLLERDPSKKVPPGGKPDQSIDFTAPGLPPGARLWSKAGWTSTARHDAAYVELPGGHRFVLVIFTTGHADEREIIPAIARGIVERITRNR